MTAALVSGREDWRRRAAFFAFFGALGWSFGGSMSYMRVLAYTHTDSLPDVLYGFLCTFVIGFLWGAMGGAGTALPAVLDRDRLTEFLPPLIAIFSAWAAWDYIVRPFVLPPWVEAGGTLNLDWYGSDWIGASLALLAMLVFLAFQRRVSPASSLILHMIAGWWAGFLGLVVVLGLRMTPPRGDNWAGCLGMTVALFVYLLRKRLFPVAVAALLAAVFAGFGFSSGLVIRSAGTATGISTNWHSILEQSYGFIQGIGIAVAMGYLSARAAPVNEEPLTRPWAERFSVAFVLVALTWLNISKNMNAVWLPNKVVPERMYGLPAIWWFHFAYLALAAVVMALMARHRRAPISAMPATELGKGQVLFLVFLWWIVIGNLSRYLPFHPQRMVTEGVILLNACIATVLALSLPREKESVAQLAAPDYARYLKRIAWVGLAVWILTTAVDSGLILPLFDAPFQGARFRFGPQALEGR